MNRNVLLLLVLAAALAACGQDQPRGDPLKGGPAPDLGVRPDGLPAGHPPLDAPAAPAGMLPADPSPVPFQWTAPASWKQTPASGMRLAQFDVPGTWPDGTAVQCVVFTQMGGGVQGNIDRWKGMVRGGGDGAKVTNLEADGFKVTRIEMRGAYTDSMMGGPSRSSDDALFLAAIIDTGAGDQVYTMRLVGPRTAVEPEVAHFDELLTSIKKK